MNSISQLNLPEDVLFERIIHLLPHFDVLKKSFIEYISINKFKDKICLSETNLNKKVFKTFESLVCKYDFPVLQELNNHFLSYSIDWKLSTIQFLVIGVREQNNHVPILELYSDEKYIPVFYSLKQEYDSLLK